jgi:N-acylneuraminate cytidylyltransferase
VFEGKRLLALICARGGSKGLPRKNLRILGKDPLVVWSIKAAQECGCFDRIVVSTDDNEIAAVARNYGAEVPFLRPSDLAQDRSAEWLVWQHAIFALEKLDGFKADYLTVLPPTSPFRSVKDVMASIELLYTSNADIVISVNTAHRSPYFNMIEMTAEGLASLCKKPQKAVVRRQDAPLVFDMTTVCYTARTGFVASSSGIFDGKVKAVVVPELRALDIDTSVDLKFAEFLLSQGMIDGHG